jgi:uncharacterized protein
LQPASNVPNQHPTGDSIALDGVTTGKQSRRGFAAMSRDRLREIASLGGRAAHQKGTAHRWTTEEARAAGRKGGHVSHPRRQRTANGQYLGGETRKKPEDTGQSS